MTWLDADLTDTDAVAAMLAPAPGSSRDSLIAVLLVLLIGAAIWLLDRLEDVRANRREVQRRRDFARRDAKAPAALAARTGVVLGAGSYPSAEKIHDRRTERQS